MQHYHALSRHRHVNPPGDPSFGPYPKFPKLALKVFTADDGPQVSPGAASCAGTVSVASASGARRPRTFASTSSHSE